MRESCSCGAGIQALSYNRILLWRLSHLHPTDDGPTHEVLSDTSFPIGFRAEEEEE
jgi:hypothetical protein